jgi:hypothetical protein
MFSTRKVTISLHFGPDMFSLMRNNMFSLTCHKSSFVIFTASETVLRIVKCGLIHFAYFFGIFSLYGNFELKQFGMMACHKAESLSFFPRDRSAVLSFEAVFG